MGLLVAGSRSTGTTGMLHVRYPPSRAVLTLPLIACWLITFLAGHPEWRSKARSEAEAFLFSHSSYTSGVSVASSLATVPLEAWETEMPVFDAIIRETLRLAQPHTAMRRNVGPDTFIGGERVPSGAYVVYPFSDVHLDEGLYPDPWKFDPGRPERKEPYSWIGWGGGTSAFK